jgi:putative MFS transporter
MTAQDKPLAGAPESLTAYQRRLVAFLSVATFFEGFDFFALSQLLPNLRAAMRLSQHAAGAMVALINVGTVIAYLLVRKADQWGRRRVLSVTILGYTVFSVLSGLAPGALVFALCQMVARVFLIGEWVIAMVYAAEEFPAHRRGHIIGVIQACSSLGSVVCAGVLPALLRTSLGWRAAYFVGALPLFLVAVARRGLRETARFAQAQPPATRRPFAHIFRTPFRARMLTLASVWFLTYLCTQTAITFWKEFAVAERGMGDAQVGGAITVAALAAMPLAFGAGKLLDVVGRRRGAALIFVLTSLGVFGAYHLRGRAALTLALIAGIFGSNGVLPVLNAYNTELFPTDLRGDAFAWSNNLLGRVGYVLAPLVVGYAAERVGWGQAVGATAVFPLLGLAVILWKLPETRGQELEQSAALR